MIYLSDDYLEKYIDTLAYILERATYEEYSFDSIQKRIAYSSMINEFEKSNITLIAFSSNESLYQDIFPYKENRGYKHNIYGVYGWIAECYIRLFLELNITFELLFIILPIELMLEKYKLYHEMSFSHVFDLFHELVLYSYLDNVLKYRSLSTNDLAIKTGIPFSSINALRYNKRDINKLESSKLLTISRVLSIKMESLLTNIYLEKM